MFRDCGVTSCMARVMVVCMWVCYLSASRAHHTQHEHPYKVQCTQGFSANYSFQALGLDWHAKPCHCTEQVISTPSSLRDVSPEACCHGLSTGVWLRHRDRTGAVLQR